FCAFIAQKIRNIGSSKVTLSANIIDFTKPLAFLLSQQLENFLLGKKVIFSLLALGIRILGRKEQAAFILHFLLQIGKYTLTNLFIERFTCALKGQQISHGQHGV